MIYGIGTDIIAVSRMAQFHERHGVRALEKLLAPVERQAFATATDPARHLAKRFAAKEALGKALGTGIRAPVLLPAIAVIHDALGKPAFEFFDELGDYVAQKRLRAHLSLTDERDYVVAFVVVETE